MFRQGSSELEFLTLINVVYTVDDAVVFGEVGRWEAQSDAVNRTIGRYSDVGFIFIELYRIDQKKTMVPRSDIADEGPLGISGFFSERRFSGGVASHASMVLLRYLNSDPPSIFVGKYNANDINAVIFLMGWTRLGADAHVDQIEYLRNLSKMHPENIDAFLQRMFRVDFIDDYTGLKQIFDYEQLSQLIDENESILDVERVKQFRERFARESFSPSVVSAPDHENC